MIITHFGGFFVLLEVLFQIVINYKSVKSKQFKNLYSFKAKSHHSLKHFSVYRY